MAASQYYFTSDAATEGKANIKQAFYFAWFKHSGSLAFGSFILAVIRFIEIIFMYICEKAEQASGDNQMVKIITGCAKCCLKCIEKICDYLNTSAYAMMAISG